MKKFIETRPEIYDKLRVLDQTDAMDRLSSGLTLFAHFAKIDARKLYTQGLTLGPNGPIVYAYDNANKTATGHMWEFNYDGTLVRESDVDWCHGNQIQYKDDKIYVAYLKNSSNVSNIGVYNYSDLSLAETISTAQAVKFMFFKDDELIYIDRLENVYSYKDGVSTLLGVNAIPNNGTNYTGQAVGYYGGLYYFVWATNLNYTVVDDIINPTYISYGQLPSVLNGQQIIEYEDLDFDTNGNIWISAGRSVDSNEMCIAIATSDIKKGRITNQIPRPNTVSSTFIGPNTTYLEVGTSANPYSSFNMICCANHYQSRYNVSITGDMTVNSTQKLGQGNWFINGNSHTITCLANGFLRGYNARIVCNALTLSSSVRTSSVLDLINHCDCAFVSDSLATCAGDYSISVSGLSRLELTGTNHTGVYLGSSSDMLVGYSQYNPLYLDYSNPHVQLPVMRVYSDGALRARTNITRLLTESGNANMYAWTKMSVWICGQGGLQTGAPHWGWSGHMSATGWTELATNHRLQLGYTHDNNGNTVLLELEVDPTNSTWTVYIDGTATSLVTIIEISR